MTNQQGEYTFVERALDCPYNSGLDCAEDLKTEEVCHKCAWYLQWRYQQDDRYGEPLIGIEKPNKHLNKWFAWKDNLVRNKVYFDEIAEMRPK